MFGVVFSPDYSNENYHFRPYLPQYVTNLEDAVPYKEWKYMEDSNGNTIPDIVEKQIAEDPLNVDNAWLEDKYGCSVEEFIKTDNVNADKNKKHWLKHFLIYIIITLNQLQMQHQTILVNPLIKL